MTSDTTIAGTLVRAGDAILAVLAVETNEDGRVEGAGSISFGYGRHACPGQAIALTITEAAVAELLRRKMIPAKLPSPVPYRPSANARIPIFGCPAQHPARENPQ